VTQSMVCAKALYLLADTKSSSCTTVPTKGCLCEQVEEQNQGGWPANPNSPGNADNMTCCTRLSFIRKKNKKRNRFSQWLSRMCSDSFWDHCENLFRACGQLWWWDLSEEQISWHLAGRSSCTSLLLWLFKLCFNSL